MRLAVIAHALKAGGGVSVGQNLMRALDHAAPHHQYLFVVPSETGYERLDLRSEDPRIIVYRARLGVLGRWMFDELVLPGLIREFHPDVVLALGNRGMTRPPCPQAVLCQNAHLFYPRRHFGYETLVNRLISRYNSWKLSQSLRRSDLLLCQTSVAAERLKAMYGYQGTISVMPNAISVNAIGDHVCPGLPSALEGHEDKFKVLCLSRYYPHKNLESIVEMFRRYGAELKDVLVIMTIAASDHPGARRLLRSIVDNGLSDKFCLVGPLRQADLEQYYRHSHALLLPTLLESFTGTYLEAMAWECPIVTSDLDFARNICGDAAQYFNPWDVESMKNAVVQLKGNPEHAASLVAMGRRRLLSTHTTWDEIARSLLVQLEALMAKPCVLGRWGWA